MHTFTNAEPVSEVIRQPAVAGKFYSNDAKQLSKKIDDLLAKPTKQIDGKPTILFVPHAGYIYSGATAAKAYKHIQGESYDTIILVGPCHRGNIDGAVIWNGTAWQTPLGKATINRELATKLAKEHPKFHLSTSCHENEHSLEVQIPFIQTVQPKAKIIPIVMNDRSLAVKLAKAITKHMDGRILLVLSSDLSHFYDNVKANKIDGQAEELLRQQNPYVLKQKLEAKAVEMCGGAAYLTGLYAGYELGHPKMHVMERTHSGNTAGDNNSVVGYFSGVVTNPEALTKEQQTTLLQYAKSIVRKHYSLPTMNIDISDPAFDKVKGIFITLRSFPKQVGLEGPLRGCIGHTLPVQSIRKDVAQMTIASAIHDSRFPPVTKEELDSMTLEISILNPPTPINSHADIVYGAHGVVIKKGSKAGVFLPEVAYHFPNTAAFLSELCLQKAGLPRDCWRDESRASENVPKTELSIFTTQKTASIALSE